MPLSSDSLKSSSLGILGFPGVLTLSIFRSDYCIYFNENIINFNIILRFLTYSLIYQIFWIDQQTLYFFTLLRTHRFSFDKYQLPFYASYACITHRVSHSRWTSLILLRVRSLIPLVFFEQVVQPSLIRVIAFVSKLSRYLGLDGCRRLSSYI